MSIMEMLKQLEAKLGMRLGSFVVWLLEERCSLRKVQATVPD
jgi:hypothetical protein